MKKQKQIYKPSGVYTKEVDITIIPNVFYKEFLRKRRMKKLERILKNEKL